MGKFQNKPGLFWRLSGGLFVSLSVFAACRDAAGPSTAGKAQTTPSYFFDFDMPDSVTDCRAFGCRDLQTPEVQRMWDVIWSITNKDLDHPWCIDIFNAMYDLMNSNSVKWADHFPSAV